MESLEAYERLKARMEGATNTEEAASSLKCLINVLGFDGAYFLGEALRQRESLLEHGVIPSPGTAFSFDYVGSGKAVGLASYRTFPIMGRLVKFGVLELRWESVKGVDGQKRKAKHVVNDDKIYKMIAAISGS